MNDYSILYRTYEDFISVSENRKVVLFDVGFANTCYKDLRNKVQFEFAVTNNFWNWHKKIEGVVEIFPPNVLDGDEIILITNSRYAFEIERQCQELGIAKENIYCYMFFDQEFDKSLYINYDQKGR